MRPLPAQCPPTLCPHRVHQGAATALGISASLPADFGESSKSAQTAQAVAELAQERKAGEAMVAKKQQFFLEALRHGPSG